jgi:nucleotide-binding universal stress UspA family protein
MRIVLASDGSDCSEEAAKFLTHLRFGPADEIIVLHILSAIPYDDDYHAKVKRLIHRAAPKILNSTLDILKPLRAKIVTLTLEGYPDTIIIDTAVEQNADVIVMGARGVKGLKLLVLGSSTRSVVINSPRHTLVVKKPISDRGIRKILFAIDGSDCSLATGHFLARLPFPDDAEIIMVHVSQSPLSDIPQKFLADAEDIPTDDILQRTGEAGEIFENSRNLLSGKFKKIDLLTRVGSPSMEIVEAADSLGADLVAVGSRGLRGLKGMLGSVSRNVLAFAQCSVLVGKVC